MKENKDTLEKNIETLQTEKNDLETTYTKTTEELKNCNDKLKELEAMKENNDKENEIFMLNIVIKKWLLRYNSEIKAYICN